MSSSTDFYDQIIVQGASPSTIFLVLSKLKDEGHSERVIQECLNALNFYPDDLKIRKLLAESYFESGQIALIEEEIERLTTQIDDLISIYKLRARLLKKEERSEEAIETLKIYLAHRPDDQEAKDIFESLKPMEETPTIDAPVTPTPTLAEIYFNQGLIDEAVNTYEKVIAENPEDKDSTKRLAELRSMVTPEMEIEKIEFDEEIAKKERMIDILEAWRARIQESFIGSNLYS